MTVVLARTVIVLLVLLTAIAGCTAMPGRRMIELSICAELGRVGVRHVERPDDLLVVLRVLGRRVREHEDRPLVDDLVRQLVHRHDLVERLLERDAVRAARVVGRSTDLAVVGDVDAGRVGDEVEDVA